MNSKFILLLCLIATFLTLLSFAKSSKSIEWIPVKYTESKMIYNFADSAARDYFLRQRKRDPNHVEVCKVTQAFKSKKMYLLSFIANAKNCTGDIKEDCWQRLHANITVRNKYIFTIVDVKKINNHKYDKSACQFAQFRWDHF